MCFLPRSNRRALIFVVRLRMYKCIVVTSNLSNTFRRGSYEYIFFTILELFYEDPSFENSLKFSRSKFHAYILMLQTTLCPTPNSTPSEKCHNFLAVTSNVPFGLKIQLRSGLKCLHMFMRGLSHFELMLLFHKILIFYMIITSNSSKNQN